MASVRTLRRGATIACAGWMLAIAGCGTNTANDASAGNDVAMTNDATRSDASDANHVTDVPSATDTGFADLVSDAFDATVATDVTDVASAADATTAYPPGPYGNAVGQTLANLNWEGYVNTTGAMVSTALPYGPTSLNALRAGHHYGLVHISEFF